jgi:hypothetical protein
MTTALPGRPARTPRPDAPPGRPARTPRPDALKPGFHGVRTHWIQGFMTFDLARSRRTAMLMVPV